jgi:pyruvate/2-oxoglutarate dehydrogenase complex dihydrolipoamide dehydrogenase (E3) component
MAMNDFDVVVIGGGSAGSRAARSATAAGARVAMINEGELGGLCILRGCMPTKAMLASAHAMHAARHLEPFGIVPGSAPKPDFTRIMARKQQIVERFKQAKIRGIESQPYEVIDARARFVEGGKLEANGRRIRARKFVLSTGSYPVIPPVPGIDSVPLLTSDDVMNLTTQPKSLIVYGSGPIGLELAQFFARIGTRVTLVNRSPFLRIYDLEAGEELLRAMNAEENLDARAGISILRLEAAGEGVVAHLSDGTTCEAEMLLAATGRRAALANLGLEHLHLDIGQGKLHVDATMCTTHPDLYAAGDITGDYQILHIANQEGEIAGYNAAGGNPPRFMDYRMKMAVVFSDPTYAQIGATEQELQASGTSYRKATVKFPQTGRAITMSVEHGLWSLLVSTETGEILGSSILGPHADDLVHTVALMMHHRDNYHVIAELPWYHPTLSEVMIDLLRQLD